MCVREDKTKRKKQKQNFHISKYNLDTVHKTISSFKGGNKTVKEQ